MLSFFQGQHLFILGGLYGINSNWSRNRRTNHHQSPNFLEIFIQIFATVAVNFFPGWSYWLMERKKSCFFPVEVTLVEIPLFTRLETTIPGWFSRRIRCLDWWFFPRLEGLLSVCREGSSVQVLEVLMDVPAGFWKGWWLMYHSVNVGFRGFLYVFY